MVRRKRRLLAASWWSLPVTLLGSVALFGTAGACSSGAIDGVPGDGQTPSSSNGVHGTPEQAGSVGGGADDPASVGSGQLPGSSDGSGSSGGLAGGDGSSVPGSGAGGDPSNPSGVGGGQADGQTGNGSPVVPNAGGAVQPTELTPEAYVPARIRRLSNSEYQRAVEELLGVSVQVNGTLPADLRQHNFTINEAQVVSSDWSSGAERIAQQAAAARLQQGLDGLVPCGDQSEACAGQFIDSFAERAFRRPVTSEEREGLLEVYRAGEAEAGFERGIELVIAAILQAPSFVYLTELGEGGSEVTLTQHEIAAQLSFLTTGAPPDDALRQSVEAGKLLEPQARSEQVRRLLRTAEGRAAMERMVVQWFAVDAVLESAKDNIQLFNENKQAFLEESINLIREVIAEHEADVRTLLTADFSVVPDALAGYYPDLGGSGRVSLSSSPRRGILTQGAFLAGHSAPTESSPVRRGAAVLRHVLCIEPPDPASVNLVVAAPPPDPSKSTRERFAAHSEDPSCQTCHQLIDPVGFAFEQFDEGGRFREMDNGIPTSAASSIKLGDVYWEFNDALEFIELAANSDLAKQCVARNVARYAFGWANDKTEHGFVNSAWATLPAEQQTRLEDVIVSLVESDLFIKRRAQ